MNVACRNLTALTARLYALIKKSFYLKKALDGLKGLDIPEYCIGSGCIAQTVWNYLYGKSITYGISDLDIAYFDDTDLSADSENEMIHFIKNNLDDIPFPLDIKNQARVHLRYKDRFGYDIYPAASLHDAIDRWPTTATSIGVRIEKDGELIVYASFGLSDLFSGIVRPNKAQIIESIYQSKVDKWIKKWPKLKIVPW